MATELGVAYLSLSLETSKVPGQAKKTFGQVEAQADDTGKKSGSSLGAGLAKGLKVGAVAVSALAATVAGLALKGGISRALNIEDATAKLRGLGHDTRSVETIMDNALASVKGTAFGLGDAATVAASVVAAGVKPGRDLQTVLTGVANSAAAAGVPLNDMGSLWAKVAAGGKAYNDVLGQVRDRGLPIYQALADQLGVTTDEVTKLASEGKISFADFSSAVSTAAGTVAEEMGKTLRGRVANTMSALGRLGEKVVAGVLPQISDGLGSAIDVLDSWAPHAEKVGEAVGRALAAGVRFIRTEVVPRLREFGAWFAAEGVPRLRAFGEFIRTEVTARLHAFGEWFSAEAMPRIREFGAFLTGTAIPAVRDFASWIGRNKDVILPLVAAVVGAVAAFKTYNAVMTAFKAVQAAATALQIAWNVALTANPIGIVIAAVAALVAGLVWFFTQTETGRQVWQTAWAAIQSAVQAVVTWWQTYVQPVITAVWGAITAAASSAAAWYQENVAPVFTAFGELVSAVVERIGAV